MTEEILDQMREQPGLYVFGDTEMPGVTFPVTVIKPLKDRPGLIFALEPKYEVEATAGGFKPSTFLAGGPYSIQNIEAQQEKELERAGLETEADYFRDIALRAEAHLRFARTFEDPKSAMEVTDLIERIESYRKSQEKLQTAPAWEGAPPLWQNNPPPA